MKELAPIVLFCYNRPNHVKQTLEALCNNILSDETSLYIYCDGYKADATEEQKSKVDEVRSIVRSKQWCKEVNIIVSEYNRGLAVSIIDGVSQIVNKHGKVIVLEDDIVTSPFFLRYMNDALNLYESCDKVMHISGYMYPHKMKLPTTFFCQLPLCWGWATWKRAWDKFNDDAKKWYDYFDSNELWDKFNVFGGHLLQQQLEDNVTGKLKTWFIKWHSSVVFNDGLALFPNISLVNNIGMDNSGEHCYSTTTFDNDCLSGYVKIEKIPIKENKQARKCIYHFYQGYWYSKRNRVRLFKFFKKFFKKDER